MQQDENTLRNKIESKMRRMFFSKPVIERYHARVSDTEPESVEQLLDDEAEVRTVARKAKYIKTAAFPVIKSFDGYD